MRKIATCLLAIAATITSSAVRGETAIAPVPAVGPQVAQEFTHAGKDGKKTSIKYLLYLPADIAKPDQKFPLVLFLHGSGERGTNLEQVKKFGPPHLIGQNKDLDSCIVVSPQCPEKTWWDTQAMKQLCDHIAKTQPVDPHRRYLTGLSMGGFGVWSMLAEHPDYWAAAIPICGGGEPTTAVKFKDVPIWVFHGAKDPAVPVKASEEMVAALKKAGGTPKFTVYPNEAHQSWIPAYNDAATWTWLLEQRR